jgi:protein-tyrosine-phosphatase
MNLKKDETNIMTVVFVCTINRWRSVTAEYLMKHLIEEKDKALLEKVRVLSAGIVSEEHLDELKEQGLAVPEPLWGYRPMPCLIFYMAKRGIDVSQHRSKPLDQDIVHRADLIVCMDKKHKDAIIATFPHLSANQVVTTTELWGPIEFPPLAAEPPGLVPNYDFCMRECDHWETMEGSLTVMNEWLKGAMNKILF